MWFQAQFSQKEFISGCPCQSHILWQSIAADLIARGHGIVQSACHASQKSNSLADVKGVSCSHGLTALRNNWGDYHLTVCHQCSLGLPMPFSPKNPQSINDPPPYFKVATVLFSRKIQLTCLQAWRWWLWPYSYIFVSSDSRECMYESQVFWKKFLGPKRKKYSCTVKISNAASGGRSTWISQRTIQLQRWSMVVGHWCFGDIWVQMG